VVTYIALWDIVLYDFFSGSKSALVGTTGGKSSGKTGIVTALPLQYEYSKITCGLAPSCWKGLKSPRASLP